MKKIFSLLLAAVLTVCSFSFVLAENGSDMHVCTPGQSIVGFSTTDLDGNPVTDAILQNADVTVINFWATWCGPCQAELPHFGAIANHFEDTPEADVQIIGVLLEDEDSTIPAAKSLLEQNGCTYLNLRADSVLNDVFNTCGYIPQTIVVDRAGTVRDHFVGGFSTQAELLDFINTWYDAIVTHADDTATITYICGPTGETIGTVEVPYGSVMPEETPVPPEIAGHTFLKWEYSGELYISGDSSDEYNFPTTYLIMGDVTATATYKAEKFKVKFYDGVTGKILKMQQVEYGNAATAPEHPEHEGWEFTGWDTDFSCVTEDLNVHGICVPTSGGIRGDVNGDGAITTQDAIITLRFAMGLIELTPEQQLAADFNNDGAVTTQDAILILRAAMGL